MKTLMKRLIQKNDIPDTALEILVHTCITVTAPYVTAVQ